MTTTPKTRTFVFDLEADGFYWQATKIHCLVLQDLDTDEVIVGTEENLPEVLHLMSEAKELIGHNIIDFDLPLIRKLYPDFKTEAIIRDTLLTSQVCYMSLLDSHSLEAWGYRLKTFKGKFEGPWDVLTQEMLDYCIQDVKVTVALWKLLQKQDISKQALELEHAFAELISKQHIQGWNFDVKAAASLYANLLEERTKVLEAIRAYFPPMLIPKTINDPVKSVFSPKGNNQAKGYRAGCSFSKVTYSEFEPSRAKIIWWLKVLYNWEPKVYTDKGQPKVDETVLSQLDWPVAKLLVQIFEIDKIIGFIATGKNAWLKLERNGKLHGKVFTLGTATARCSHNTPNIGQIPKDGKYGKACRALFKAPEGYSMVGWDAAGLQLRCLAHYLAPLDKGSYANIITSGDIHTANQEAAGLPSRDNAKTFIYAFIFGAGDGKIGKIIKGSQRDGKVIKERFLRKIPGLKSLMNAVQVRVKKRKHPHIIALDGRKIFIRSEHATLNYLLQSCEAILMKKAKVLTYESLCSQGYEWGKDFAQVGSIHDEGQLIVRKGLEHVVGETALASLRQAGEYYGFRCPLDGEYKVGTNWAETH